MFAGQDETLGAVKAGFQKGKKKDKLATAYEESNAAKPQTIEAAARAVAEAWKAKCRATWHVAKTLADYRDIYTASLKGQKPTNEVMATGLENLTGIELTGQRISQYLVTWDYWIGYEVDRSIPWRVYEEARLLGDGKHGKVQLLELVKRARTTKKITELLEPVPAPQPSPPTVEATTAETTPPEAPQDSAKSGVIQFATHTRRRADGSIESIDAQAPASKPATEPQQGKPETVKTTKDDPEEHILTLRVRVVSTGWELGPNPTTLPVRFRDATP